MNKITTALAVLSTLAVTTSGAVFLASPAEAAPASWTDQFTGSELGKRWEIINPSADSVSVKDGILNIASQPGDTAGGFNTAQNLVMLDVPRGDFTATVDVTAPVSKVFQGAGLIAWQDMDNYVRTGLTFVGGLSPSGVAIETDVETSAAFSAVSFADRPGSKAERLRLQRSGDSLTSSYWNGATWVVAGSTPVAFDTVQVGIYALGALDRTSLTASFDSFTLESTAATAPAPTTSCTANGAAEGLAPVMQLEIPAFAAWQQKPRYAYDATDSFQADANRVGYCLETVRDGQTQYVWTSMESFSPDVSKLGVPTQAEDVVRQRVDDLTVASNVPGVRTGSGQTGYLEMWPSTYEPKSSHQVAGSSATAFDTDDAPAPGRFGSFQIGAVGAQPDASVTPTTVLAINHFAADPGVALDIGMGTQAVGNPDWTFAQNAGAFSSRVLTVYASSSPVSLTESPSDGQRYPRDSDGGATATVAGHVMDTGVQTVRLTIDGNGERAVLESAGPSFTFAPRITAGLHEYDLRLETVSNGIVQTAGHWTRIVSGDVYLIEGQSNAQSAPWVTTGSVVAESPYIRSFGSTSIDPVLSGADREWNYGGGDTMFDLGAVGQWPLQMANDLLRTQKVPVALINGAHGGQPIDVFQRNDARPGDLQTHYGRTLQRLQASQTIDKLSGVFWYQGEADEERAAAHISGFRSLLADWRSDLGGAKSAEPNFYTFQVRTTGCFSVEGVATREAQRQLGFTDGVTVVSSTATPGFDGCHFTWDGYKILGNQMADTIRRDLFAGPTDGVSAPNPISASFSTSTANEVIVQLANRADALRVDAGVAGDFRVVGSDATITNVRYIGGGRLSLVLSRPAPEITGVSYHGRLNDGPFVTTSRGVGLLAFGNLPVAKTRDLALTASAESRCVSGRVVVMARANNGDTVPTTVKFTTGWGTKTMAAIAPGKSTTHAFTTRQSSVAAGTVDVTAEATVDGQAVTFQTTAAYPARSCS